MLAFAGQAPPDVNVLLVYEGMANYLSALDANPTANRKDLWQIHVTTPYWKPCAEGGEFADYAPSLATPPANTEALRSAINTIRASSLEKVVRSAIEKSASLLPTSSTTVCLLAADSSQRDLVDMHGISGFTAGAGKIWLSILPVGDWKDWITYGVAHEYHHSVWTRRQAQRQPINDMTDYLVFEGRADSFARLVEPQRRAPWTEALTSRQEREAWRTIRRHLSASSAQLLQGLMFGGTEGVPRWGGYTIGFAIVQDYLTSHSDLTVSQWTDLGAAGIVRESPYVSKQ
jgi:uncharacterized protein YjaZ